MAIAPDNHLRACLKTIYDASIQARVIGWEGEAHPDPDVRGKFHQIAELMDAIHNIPGLLLNWERCDVNRLREGLGPLGQIYDQALDEAGKGKPGGET